MLCYFDMRMTSTYLCMLPSTSLAGSIILSLTQPLWGLAILEVNTEDWDLEKSAPCPHYFWLLGVTRHRKNEMMDELTLVHSTKKVQEEILADLSKKKISLQCDPCHVLLLGQSFISNNNLGADSYIKCIEWISTASDRSKIWGIHSYSRRGRLYH